MGALLTTALPMLLPIIERAVGGIINDKGQAAQATLEIQKAVLDKDSDLNKAVFEAAKAQIDVNAAEATNPSLFVSGWRPAVGWICAIGCAYGFLFQPFLAWVVLLFGAMIHAALPAPPALDMDTLLTLLGGLLGIGGLRTIEKVKGVARNS